MADVITENIDIWSTAQTIKTNGRGKSADNQSLHGIKKLRELILELAARGKLVPQDPNDEPASVLLERIISEKKRLTEEEGLKTTAQDDINTEEEYLGKPNGWVYCRLGNLAKFIDYRGGTPKKLEDGIPLITAKNVRFGYISREPKEYISENEYHKWMTRGFPRINDVLFTTEAPLGNVALIDIEEKFALAQRVICFQLHEPSIAYFLRMLIMSPVFQNQLADKASGMTATGIKAAKLKEIVVPMPPLAEQHCIVARVDELMSFCDQLEQQQTDSNAAHQTLVETLLTTLTDAADQDELETAWQRIANHFDTLFTTEYSIDQLKQTILQLAVMGKLVPQDSNDEPASILLDKIAKEKARLIKEGKTKSQNALPEVDEFEKPFELPMGWTWAQWDKIALKIGDIDHKMPDQANDGYPYVSPRDFLPNNGIDLEGAKKISKEDFLRLAAKIQPQRGDIIYPRYGTIGENRLIETDADFLASYSCCVIKTMHDFIEPKYQFIFSVSILAKNQAKQAENKTTQANVGIKSIQNYLVPLPPYAEQQRIVAKVDELMTLCDTLKARLNDAQTIQIQLADAIVEEAVV